MSFPYTCARLHYVDDPLHRVLDIICGHEYPIGRVVLANGDESSAENAVTLGGMYS